MKRATTPKTPDTIRSRAKTPEQSRRSSLAGPGANAPIAPMPHKERASTVASLPDSLPASKPKVFCEKDFNKFLARQDLHKTMHAKHHQVPNGLLAGLRATPLCPILSGNGYVIHGSIYVEADFRNKRQKGRLPTWSRSRPASSMSTVRLHVTTADENPRFRAFWHRQKESLDRKRARLQNRAPSVPMPQKSQAEIQDFLKRKQEEVLGKAASIRKQQDEAWAEVCLSSPYAQKLHSKEATQPPDFLERHYRNHEDFRNHAVTKALAKWKVDNPHEAGESKVLDNSKVITLAEAEAFYAKVSEYPNCANREPPNREPKILEPVFRLSGNPYQGGKADLLAAKLGHKAGLHPLPASVD